jgi:hypothetical protein
MIAASIALISRDGGLSATRDRINPIASKTRMLLSLQNDVMIP